MTYPDEPRRKIIVEPETSPVPDKIPETTPEPIPEREPVAPVEPEKVPA